MRFSAPRTESDEEEDTYEVSDDSESETEPVRASPRSRQEIEDSVAAIRLRAQHNDPYVEWQRKTRKDAFRSARSQHKALLVQLQSHQSNLNAKHTARLDIIHQQQMTQVQTALEKMRVQQQQDEAMLREKWKQREDMLLKRVEQCIKLEEDNAKEEERKKREALEKKRLEEERRLAEEQARRKAEEEAEEEAKRKKEEEAKRADEERQQKEKEEREKQERLQAEAKQRQQIGLTSADDDWKMARRDLHLLKSGPMKQVKENREMRAEWGNWRRQITPKIGQLTDDAAAINTISTQLYRILKPARDHHALIYTALLSSLAKSIILQAETEVTAKKDSAGPLAAVAFNLLQKLQDFDQVFFAKLVQRVGGWPVPCMLPQTDYDGRPWKDDEEKIKVMGFRTVSDDKGRERKETEAEYASRVSGIMRVYFSILRIRTSEMPCPMFRMPRAWTWFARVMGEMRMLESSAGAEVIYTALDVIGSDARSAWGQQFMKVLAIIYSGVKEGVGNGRYIGGTSPEGKAARVRVELKIEKIMT